VFGGLDTGRVGKPAWATIAATFAVLCFASRANADPSLEYAVKAAYLYKLAAFVEWPPSRFDSPNSPLHICIIGEDPFKAVLDQAVAGVAIAGRPVQVARYDAAQPNMGCHIAYVAGGTAQSRADALKALRGDAVLTVTDRGRGPADPGADQGIVSFVLKDNRVRFDIDQRQAVDDHLSLSGKLLSLALDVRR
jgi:YfiR/HmsC-like